MKNKQFFYLQYNTIEWQNQEATKINSLVNNYIIDEIITKKQGSSIKIFDIGFGIGFFIKMLCNSLNDKYADLLIAGCEPSKKNYDYFVEQDLQLDKSTTIAVENTDFLETKTDQKFDFITAIYVFPHILADDLEDAVKKIYFMLEPKGKFILVVANEEYIEEKLKSMKDLFIERNVVELNGKSYKEVLHYSNIPEIGKVIDYNRESALYIDLFNKHGFELENKTELDDNGFICSVFVFQKMQ